MRIEPSVIEMAPGLPLSLQALLAGRLRYRGGTGASSEAGPLTKDLNLAARARSLCHSMTGRESRGIAAYPHHTALASRR